MLITCEVLIFMINDLAVAVVLRFLITSTKNQVSFLF